MKNRTFRVLGLMSGTSIDGIDLSIIETDGIDIFNYHKNIYHEYNTYTKKKLFDILDNFNYDLRDKTQEKKNSHFISKLYVDLIKKNNANFNIDIIGFHGQTVYHNPKKNISIQLGDPKLISRFLNKPVVYDFRSNDLNNGGQGAPLAPIYHKYLIEKNNFKLPSCFLNIGGIANITYWDGKKLIGFDTGPGNCLLDDYIKSKTKLTFDRGGKIASKGKVLKDFVSYFLQDKYFFENYPKSLDRNYFKFYLQALGKKDISLEDGLATLTEITIQTILISLKKLPKEIKTIFTSGGGSHNKYLLSKLNLSLKPKILLDNFIDIDFVESQLIAYLAARSINKLPITFPYTTGVKKPLRGGKIINL